MLNKNKQPYEQSKSLRKACTQYFSGISTNPQQLIQPLLNLYTNLSKEKTAVKLLIILFFILPWNLGKHYEQPSSFVGSLLVPYLVPTVYLQDILVVLIVLCSVWNRCRGNYNVQDSGVSIALRLFFLFLIPVFLATFFAKHFYPSIYFFERLALYCLFFAVSINLFRVDSISRWFTRLIMINMFLLSVLGFLQFSRQASVFNNYLFFGEQPYSVFTPSISKESFNGVTKIPPYATFLHPNIFAGYLVVSLTLSLGCFMVGRKPRIILLIPPIVAGSVALFLTKSYTAWAAFALGFLLFIVVRLINNTRIVRKVFLLLISIVVVAGFLFPLYMKGFMALIPVDAGISALSLERRSALLSASYKMISQKPFFGWGINSFTYNFEPFYVPVNVVRFLQPVHNIYALIASETGVFGVILFLSLTLCAIYFSVRRGNFLFGVILLQITVISCFDHYFFTIPQTLLLFILTLMMGLTYTKSGDCL